MEESFLIKFWPLLYAAIREFWQITEPEIEDAALRLDVPIELYYYSELGLDHFSVEDFQRRDPFTNPEQFERLFARLEIKDWIEPVPVGKFQVTPKARKAVRQIIQAGDRCLDDFKPRDGLNLPLLLSFLKQITMANGVEREPPEKWAISRRFRVAEKDSAPIAQVREYLMDIYAYRDDSHLSAARPHFNEAGIVWLVLGVLVSGKDVTAQYIAKKLDYRGYEAFDYQIALDAAVEIGWAELTDVPGIYCSTRQGRELHEQVEQLTNEYFYRPWSVMMTKELDELYTQLTKLHDQLVEFKKMK